MAFLSGIANKLGKATKATGKPGLVAGSGLKAKAPKAIAKPAVKNIGSTSGNKGLAGGGMHVKVK